MFDFISTSDVVAAVALYVRWVHATSSKQQESNKIKAALSLEQH